MCPGKGAGFPRDQLLPGHQRAVKTLGSSGVMGPVLNLWTEGGPSENISKYSRGVKTEEEEQR